MRPNCLSIVFNLIAIVAPSWGRPFSISKSVSNNLPLNSGFFALGRKIVIGFVPAIAGLACLLTTSAACAQLRIVALENMAAPGSSDDFSGFGVPVLNNRGEVAFAARLTSIGGYGVFAESNTTLECVVLSGTELPGASGVTIGNMRDVNFNESGQVAFRTRLEGNVAGDGSDNSAILSTGSGSLLVAAREGQNAPGHSGVQLFEQFESSFFSPPPPLLNDQGETSFVSNLVGQGVVNFGGFQNDSALYVELGGTLIEVLREGEPAPLLGSTGDFGPVNSERCMNNHGQVAFEVLIINISPTSSNDSAIYRGAPGSLSIMTFEGNNAPGTIGTFEGINAYGPPSLNDAGAVAFEATFREFIQGHFVGGSGIFTAAGAGVGLVARDGNQAFDLPPGVEFDKFGSPLINANNEVTFSATVENGGVTSGTDEALFSNGLGIPHVVAREGSQVPDLATGVHFGDTLQAGFNTVTFSSLTMNSKGQTAFLAGLTGVGVNGTNNVALFAEGLDGMVRTIVREGDLITIGTGDVRTVHAISFVGGTGNQDGRRSAFNDAGLLTFRLAFVDGSSGVFVSDDVATQPTTVSPETLTVGPGVLASGGLAELGQSDNLDLRVFRDVGTVSAVTQFTLTGTSPATMPTQFDFVLEGSCVARSNVVQQVEFFNYQTSSFEVMDIRNSNRSPAPDLIVAVSATGDLSRFVDQATGEIQARVRYQADVNRLQFSSNTDQAIWVIAD